MALPFCGFTDLSDDRGAWSQSQAQISLCSLSIPAWLLLCPQNPRADVQVSHSYLEVTMALHIFFVVILKAYLSRAKNRTYFM